MYLKRHIKNISRKRKSKLKKKNMITLRVIHEEKVDEIHWNDINYNNEAFLELYEKEMI